MSIREWKKLKKILYGQNGTSLVEILVSIAILGVVVVPLASMFLSSIRTDYEAEMRLKALTIAQKCMEEQKKANTLPDNVTEEEINSGDSRFKAYRVISKHSAAMIERNTGISTLNQDTVLFIELDSSGSMTIRDRNGSGTDDSFEPAGDNTRILTINKSGGYQYTDSIPTIIQSDSGLDIRNVVIFLNSSLEGNFNLEVDNKKAEMVDIYVYDDSGHVDISGTDGDISIYEHLTVNAEDFDDLAVYDITIIVKNATTGMEIERIQSQKMMYK